MTLFDHLFHRLLPDHLTHPGLEDDENIELTDEAVEDGDVVVIQGNAELEKGMAVEIEPAAGEAGEAAEATSQAATQESSSQPAATAPSAGKRAVKAEADEDKK